MAKTDRELRRMSRVELIEIIYQLQQQIIRLEEEKTSLQQKLDDKKILLQQAGSIAQAALSLNAVFEAAQKAADQYLDSVKYLANVPPEQMQEMTEDTPQDSDSDWIMMAEQLS